jgi:hypothetical protein
MGFFKENLRKIKDDEIHIDIKKNTLNLKAYKNAKKKHSITIQTSITIKQPSNDKQKLMRNLSLLPTMQTDTKNPFEAGKFPCVLSHTLSRIMIIKIVANQNDNEGNL